MVERKRRDTSLKERLAQSKAGRHLLKNLDDWLDLQPVPERTELAAALASEDDVEFYSAELELFIGALMAQRGWKFVRHPELPNTAKRPDYRVDLAGEAEDLIVEARMSIDLDLLRRDRVMRELRDALDAVTGREWVHVTIEGDFPGDFSIPRARDAIASSVTALRESGHPSESRLAYSQGGCQLILKVMATDRGTEGPVVSGWQFGAAAKDVTTRGRLDRAISKKAGRYGVLDLPFMVAVAAHHDFPLTRHGVTTTLYGTRQLDISVPHDPSEPFRLAGEHYERDGIFTSVMGDEPIRTRVSAVAIYNRIAESDDVESQVSIFHNPFAQHRLDHRVFRGIPQFDVKDDGDEQYIRLAWDRDPPDWWDH